MLQPIVPVITLKNCRKTMTLQGEILLNCSAGTKIKNCDHDSINCASCHSKKLKENNYSSGKNSFKLLRGNINKNCDVHVAINCASYHSKKLQENN